MENRIGHVLLITNEYQTINFLQVKSNFVDEFNDLSQFVFVVSFVRPH